MSWWFKSGRALSVLETALKNPPGLARKPQEGRDGMEDTTGPGGDT